MARLGDIVVGLRANTAGFKAAIGGAQKSVGKFRQAISGMGGAAGLVALAMSLRASVGAAIEFEAEMVKIITLVGASEEQVKSWSKSLRKMAQETGRGPRELARALFVVTSAGERGANALKIVEKAAKASAIGLGDTAQIARAVTATMQAYASSGMTAARATDVLVATVREGNLEASALAGSLGRVIGIAAEVGITFADVGAFVATFTRVGVSAEEAVTSLRTVIGSFLKPSTDAAKAMKEMGLSAEGLRQSIRDRGLAPTLVDLANALKGNEAMLARVIPEFRALAGFMSVASAQGETFKQVAIGINNSAGVLEDGFRRFGETGQAAIDQIKVAAENLQISLGDKLLPIIANTVEAWSLMLDPAQLTRNRLSEWASAAGDDMVKLQNAINGMTREQANLSGGFIRNASDNTIVKGIGSNQKLRAVLDEYTIAIHDAMRELQAMEIEQGKVNATTAYQTALIGNLAPVVREIAGGAGNVASAMSSLGGVILPMVSEDWIRLNGTLKDSIHNLEILPSKIADVGVELETLRDKLEAIAIQAGESITRALVRGFLDGAKSLKEVILGVFKQIIEDIIVMIVTSKIAQAFANAAAGAGGGGEKGKSFSSRIFSGVTSAAMAFAASGGNPAAAGAGFGAGVLSSERHSTNITITKGTASVDPFTAANDATWQQVIAETNRALARGGHRVSLAVI